MTDKVVIFVTAASRRECKKIARHLVETKLAACVNVSQPMEEIYRWEGKMAEEREFLLIIKSSGELFPEIEAEISKIHRFFKKKKKKKKFQLGLALLREEGGRHPD